MSDLEKNALGGPREAAKRKTTEKVVAAAREWFLKLPYEDVSIRCIASTAGFSTGAIFNSFADKAAVYEAAMGEPPPAPMTMARFFNALKIMRSLDRDEIEVNDCDMTDIGWVHFRRNPAHMMLEFEPRIQRAIWRAIEKRQPKGKF